MHICKLHLGDARYDRATLVSAKSPNNPTPLPASTDMRQVEQRRGDRDAYRRYLDGMDASMRQKVALTAAHLLGEGRVADMGMGSGTGSHALASLYPALEVIGVDLSETMVELARERYGQGLPNLEFVVGDIAAPVFAPGTLDGIFDSSVLHHVTSFGGYDHAAAARALAAQVGQLREHGVLVVRDFLAPAPGDGDAWLDLPADDGDAASSDPRSCSTARLFERFATEFRSLSAAPGFAYERVGRVPSSPLAREVIRYRVAHRLAVEFVLRKDYRTDWEGEVKEEYTYFTQQEFEGVFARLGLRVVASTPLRNPWIVRNRLRGKIELRAVGVVGGQLLEEPATNYVIVGERVPPGEGVRFEEGDPEQERSGFLTMDHHRNVSTGRVLDLVRRPHLTLDVLPWFDVGGGGNGGGGDLYVLARKSYPRPILQCRRRGSPLLGDLRPPGYVTEPLYVFQEDKPVGLTVEEALERHARLAPEHIHGFRPGATYYPSPGGILEEVRSVLVEIEPRFVEKRLENLSGFSTSGIVRAIEARQLLRAAQVGGLPDARLELNVYQLLASLGRDAGPWIGEELRPSEVADVTRTPFAALRGRPSRRLFRRAGPDESVGFLEIHRSWFEELDATGGVVARRALEFGLPRPLSFNTIVAAPIVRGPGAGAAGGEPLLGIDEYDLPAAQCFNGNSDLLVAPAWRLPRAVTTMSAARAWLIERLEQEHGLLCGEIWELGGPYHPTLGVTPEVVHPVAVEVVAEVPSTVKRRLAWVSLREALANTDLLLDGHLRIAAMRAAHALGLLT